MFRMINAKTDDTHDLLLKVKLFEGMTPTQLDWVARNTHRRSFEAGRNVMTIEQPGDRRG